MKTSYDRINDIIGEEGERPEAKKFVKQFDFTGDIEFKDVTFSYPGTNIQVIKNVSFKIKNGDKVAFIGKIGSGKTTIQKLIMGLYEPDSGSILINGIDIKQIDPAELRNNISYVSQDINLFNGTAKENIAYRASYADDDTIMLAAKISGADEFIKNHPRGYDMPIYERGMGLSGGQKQSIGIARALLVNSPIVLMDEPSNAMDQTTEKDLFDSFKNNLSDKTVIYITQKMALLDIVDRVIVINDGKLFADGNKQEVIKALKGEKQNEK
jgi:ATP-binding cassette subfamily C protein LapB